MRFLSVADVYVMSFMPPLHRFSLWRCRTGNLFTEGDKDRREGGQGILGNMEDDAANGDAEANDDDDDRNNCVCG